MVTKFARRRHPFEGYLDDQIQEILNRINELHGFVSDGWIPLPALTYATPTTATIATDWTDILQKGYGVKLTQHGVVKFFCIYVIPTYSSPDTTITAIGNDAAGNVVVIEDTATYPITSAYWTPNPQGAFGFPDIFSYVPVLDGFSADPADACYQFKIAGQEVTVFVSQPTAGTSDANNFTITAPVTARTVTNGCWSASIYAQDNGGSVVVTSIVKILSNTNILVVCKGLGAAGWTTSGDKCASFQISYPI